MFFVVSGRYSSAIKGIIGVNKVVFSNSAKPAWIIKVKKWFVEDRLSDKR